VSRQPRIVSLDQLEAIPGPGTLTWHPVRAALGIRAFGCNAYTASRAGDDVVEPHRESPESAHEELYFVARGHARFTIDGEQHDAPAGTYVFIPDPESRRHAVAQEPGTTVLSFGGPLTFEPSDWEWSFRGAALMHSDPARAREIFDEGLELRPLSGGLHYNLACLLALQDEHDNAVAHLRRAIELRPEVAEWAAADDDLARLRNDPAFRLLLGR
jgi:tetratricopeptide (TPR) repeat protein